MDIPLCLEYLTQTGRLRASDDWGPCANSDDLYPDFADGWRGRSPVPTLAEMDIAWSAVLAARRRPRAPAALVQEIGALAAADRNRLFALVAADYLRQHPAAARQLGIALDGDERDV